MRPVWQIGQIHWSNISSSVLLVAEEKGGADCMPCTVYMQCGCRRGPSGVKGVHKVFSTVHACWWMNIIAIAVESGVPHEIGQVQIKSGASITLCVLLPLDALLGCPPDLFHIHSLIAICTGHFYI